MKKRTFFVRLLIPIILITIFQVVFTTVFLYANGVIKNINQNSLDILTGNLENRRNILQSKMLTEWSNVDMLETEILQRYNSYAKQAGGIEHIINDNNKQNLIAEEISDDTLITLRLTGATGIYVLLKTNEDYTYNGIYFRDPNPGTASDDYSDVTMFVGDSDIAKGHNISLDSFWSRQFYIKNLVGLTYTSIVYPQQAYQNNYKLTSKQAAYWEAPHSVDSDSRNTDSRQVITYTRPLIVDGVVVGVIGTDIAVDVLSKFFPASDFSFTEKIGYTLLKTTDSIKCDILAINGPYITRAFSKYPDITLHNVRDYENIQSVRTEDEDFLAAISDLNIYSPNTPFYNYTWRLSVIADRHTLFKLGEQANRTISISHIIAAIVCSLVLFIVVRRHSRPLRYIIQQVNSEEIIDNNKINTRELDTLATLINNYYTKQVEIRRRNTIAWAVQILSQSVDLKKSLLELFDTIYEIFDFEKAYCHEFDNDFMVCKNYLGWRIKVPHDVVKITIDDLDVIGHMLGDKLYTIYTPESFESDVLRECFCADCSGKYYLACFMKNEKELTGKFIFMRSTPFTDEDISLFSELVNIIGINMQSNRSNLANRTKSEFLSRMSHEIRTPMNAIIGLTRMASENLDDEFRVKDYLNKIDVSSKHLLSLINAVLDMSKIDSGKLELDKKPFNLHTFTETVDTIIGSQMEKVTFTKNICITDENVIGDEYRLRQVIINLLGNAVKFTPENGNIYLTIKEIEPLKYYFSVKDTGIGIPEDNLQKVFDAFEQVDTDKKSEGSGLGLAISWNIVNAMGGKLELDSTVGKGSDFHFTLTLPGGQGEQGEQGEQGGQGGQSPQNQEQEGQAQLKSEQPKPNFKGKKILLVEDNEINIEIATYILQQAEISVDVAVNGQLGVDMFFEKPENYYDCILMDIQMPIMDGLTATRKIRKGEFKRKSRVPIISMSANAFDEDTKKSLDAGMDASVPKPIDTEFLFSVLSNVFK